MSRLVTRLLASAAVLGLILAAPARGQQPDCGLLLGALQTALPNNVGTLPGSADLTTAFGSNYLYVLTQWGFARASLSNPANPGPYNQFIIGREGPTIGGVIPILCDCHQGSNVMDVAEAPNGTARMISDWQPSRQSDKSGQPAQLAQATVSGNLAFGQQIKLSVPVPLGSRVAAVYFPSTGKYFGYFPTEGGGVEMADLTSPTGDTSMGGAIEPVNAIAWQSLNFVGVVLRAATVTTSTYSKTILVGTTNSDSTLHVAEVAAASGNLTEVAAGPLVGYSSQLDVAVVNDEIFIFSAEQNSGLQVYEFVPGTGVFNVGSIPGNALRVAVRGPAPFPALFLHRQVGANSYIDVYDTKWLTQGGTPLLAKSLSHAPVYWGNGFEALVVQSGPQVIAYLYREIQAPPPRSIHTDTLDISCIAADPNAPPIPYVTMTNLSSQGRGDGVNYFGDRWQIKDSSVSYKPITELDWDFHNTGAFAAETIQAGASVGGTTYNPAYWPCDELNGGDLGSGTGCYQSLGAPTVELQAGSPVQEHQLDAGQPQDVHVPGRAGRRAAALDRRL